MAKNAFDLSDLRQSIEQRRLARRALRDLSTRFAGELVLELRSGDSVDLYVDNGSGSGMVTYTVKNFCWQAQQIIEDNDETPVRFIRATVPALVRRAGGNPQVVVHDPRPEIWVDEEGEEWKRIGRNLYEMNVFSDLSNSAMYAVRIANDLELLRFGTEAPQLKAAFAEAMQAEMDEMNEAIEGLLGLASEGDNP
jgi:hypothetical protein